ncbi:MAG: hypothetical protein K2M67_07315 [Muribaculaceae bacterium]|nr:hypothetical protein [Muribaculaceae bacterium]
MKITTISDEQIYALEQAIRAAVQERIDTDPDVADCYLRINDEAIHDLAQSYGEMIEIDIWTPVGLY